MTDRRICYSCGRVEPWPRPLRVWYSWTDGAEFAFCNVMCALDAGMALNESMVDSSKVRDHDKDRWARRRIGLTTGASR